MSQSIVDPKEQIRFAAFLEQLATLLERKHAMFMESVAAAEVICRDQKYTAFRKEVTSATDALAVFEKASRRYAGQLEGKGRLGVRYLEN